MLAVQVVEPLGAWEAVEDGDDIIVDLRPVFRSDFEQSLTYEVVRNSRADLVTAEIEEWALRLTMGEDQFGDSELAVRAVGTTDGQEAQDTLSLHIASVNDWPILVAPMADLTLPEGATAVVDLTEHFADVEQEADQLVYSVAPFEVSFPGGPAETAQRRAGTIAVGAVS